MYSYLEDKEIQIQKLRRRIAELERRLIAPKEWSSGEIDLFKRQIRSARTKIIELNT